MTKTFTKETNIYAVPILIEQTKLTRIFHMPNISNPARPGRELLCAYDNRLPIIPGFVNKQSFIVRFAQSGTVAGHHFHRRKIELDWILSGTARFLLENTKTKQQEVIDIDADSHRVILIPKYVSHAIMSLADNTVILGVTNGYDVPEDILPYEIKGL